MILHLQPIIFVFGQTNQKLKIRQPKRQQQKHVIQLQIKS